MSILDLLAVFRRRLVAILASLAVCVGCAFGLLVITPVTWTATATAYVRVNVADTQGDSASTGAYYQASQLAAQKVKAFIPVFTSTVVAQGVDEKLGLGLSPAAVASRVHASNDLNSLTIRVTGTAETPDLAQEIADETVRQAATQIRILEGESSPVEVVLMASSALTEPYRSPSPKMYLGLGAFVGLAIGALIALLREMLDRRVSSSVRAEAALGAPCLGTVPISKRVALWGKDSDDESRQVEESLRKIRTNLGYSRIDSGLSSLLVTSAMEGEGKSTLSHHLARVIALAGRPVVLVEADLRRPVFTERFGIPQDRPGLTHVLAGSVSVDEALWTTAVPGLSVIAAGDVPANPSELLSSERMRTLIRTLAVEHMVILDATPVLPVTDAVALSREVDGVLVVSDVRTTVDQLRLLRNSLASAGGAVLGFVLNKVRSGRRGSYGYGASEYAYTARAYRAERRSPGTRGRFRRGLAPRKGR